MILNNLNSVYTIEAVLSGHPDKVCDQICDAILDSFISLDKKANVTVECMGTGDHLFIGGEVASNAKVDIEHIALATYRNIGYNNDLKILNMLQQESIQTNNPIKDGAAGDQGVMYGFACKTDYNNLPYGVYLVNAIAKRIDILRHATHDFLPDGKVQVTINNNLIESLVICVQHDKECDVNKLRENVMGELTKYFPELQSVKKIFFNYNSKFTSGGFAIDAGLSGRKIISDTYCGLAPHGGGSFSGKDPFRLDRSGAYMARFIANNIVANNLAQYCLVSLAYVFGYEKPVMIDLKTENQGRNDSMISLIKDKFDLRPPAIVERLDLYNALFLPTATYGHFTNSDYSWEKIIDL